MQNRQLIFSPRKPYDLVAEPLLRRDKFREATSNSLHFFKMCLYTTQLELILSKILTAE